MHQTIGKTYQLLGRPRLNIRLPEFDGKRVLVTGAEGYIGSFTISTLDTMGAIIWECDLNTGNVLNKDNLSNRFEIAEPDIVIHLAAHKYATKAEEDPAKVAELNIIGTHNVTELAAYYDAKLVLASTCKAVDPCTAYGASKLIAEKIVLNYWNGTVFRLVNVVGSTGSVIDIWNNLPEEVPLPVTDAWRYWISAEEAVSFLLACTDLTGLYIPNTHKIGLHTAITLADRYNPERSQKLIPLRRGDRYKERLVGEYEQVYGIPQGSILRVKEPWTRSN